MVKSTHQIADLDGIPIKLRASSRAKRLSLRICATTGAVTLTTPRSVSNRYAMEFANSKRDWIEKQLSHLTPRPLASQAKEIPFQGRMVPIVAERTRGARFDPATNHILIPSDTQKRGPALHALFKTLARERLAEASDKYAQQIGRDFQKITLRDTKSRWGSCTSDGNLMYSWRLIMAPPDTLDYVAAHEVAHLAHMNHSRKYWSLVEQLFPTYRTHRDWLKTNGQHLQSWDFD